MPPRKANKPPLAASALQTPTATKMLTSGTPKYYPGTESKDAKIMKRKALNMSKPKKLMMPPGLQSKQVQEYN